MVETEEVEGLVAVSSTFGEVGLGPRVLATSSHGFLMESVNPGVPVRSLTPQLVNVESVARLLVNVRSLPVPSVVKGNEPLAALNENIVDLAGDDIDGFGGRVCDALDALAPWLCGSTVLAHGDYQFGNVLTSDSAAGDLMLIDAAGVSDTGFFDAGRLAVHATCDALGAGLRWNIVDVVNMVADAAEVDVEGVAAMAKMMAAHTALYIKRCVPSRSWEWKACDHIYGCLDR